MLFPFFWIWKYASSTTFALLHPPKDRNGLLPSAYWIWIVNFNSHTSFQNSISICKFHSWFLNLYYQIKIQKSIVNFAQEFWIWLCNLTMGFQFQNLISNFGFSFWNLKINFKNGFQFYSSYIGIYLPIYIYIII